MWSHLVANLKTFVMGMYSKSESVPLLNLASAC